jgi:hypothetical protein
MDQLLDFILFSLRLFGEEDIMVTALSPESSHSMN